MYKILVPVDGSNHSLKALHIACDLAHKYEARIILLHVLATGKSADEILELSIAGQFTPSLREKLKNAAQDPSTPVSKSLLDSVGKKVLEISAGKVHRVGLESEKLALAQGDPAENILIAHRLVGASTIVMGSRGVSTSAPSAFGSVSNTVFAEAECTCISVK